MGREMGMEMGMEMGGSRCRWAGFPVRNIRRGWGLSVVSGGVNLM